MLLIDADANDGNKTEEEDDEAQVTTEAALRGQDGHGHTRDGVSSSAIGASPLIPPLKDAMSTMLQPSTSTVSASSPGSHDSVTQRGANSATTPSSTTRTSARKPALKTTAPSSIHTTIPTTHVIAATATATDTPAITTTGAALPVTEEKPTEQLKPSPSLMDSLAPPVIRPPALNYRRALSQPARPPVSAPPVPPLPPSKSAITMRLDTAAPSWRKPSSTSVASKAAGVSSATSVRGRHGLAGTRRVYTLEAPAVDIIPRRTAAKVRVVLQGQQTKSESSDHVSTLVTTVGSGSVKPRVGGQSGLDSGVERANVRPPPLLASNSLTTTTSNGFPSSRRASSITDTQSSSPYPHQAGPRPLVSNTVSPRVPTALADWGAEAYDPAATARSILSQGPSPATATPAADTTTPPFAATTTTVATTTTSTGDFNGRTAASSVNPAGKDKRSTPWQATPRAPGPAIIVNDASPWPPVTILRRQTTRSAEVIDPPGRQELRSHVHSISGPPLTALAVLRQTKQPLSYAAAIAPATVRFITERQLDRSQNLLSGPNVVEITVAIKLYELDVLDVLRAV